MTYKDDGDVPAGVIDRALAGKLDDLSWLLVQLGEKNITPETAVAAAGFWLGQSGRDKDRLKLAHQILEELTRCGYLAATEHVDDEDED